MDGILRNVPTKSCSHRLQPTEDGDDGDAFIRLELTLRAWGQTVIPYLRLLWALFLFALTIHVIISLGICNYHMATTLFRCLAGMSDEPDVFLP